MTPEEIRDRLILDPMFCSWLASRRGLESAEWTFLERLGDPEQEIQAAQTITQDAQNAGVSFTPIDELRLDAKG